MINTGAVNYDSNPDAWFADNRVQNLLPREYALDFVNLLHYAMKLSATTGSDYVDGEFSYSSALIRVPNLAPEAIDAMVEAHLVECVDGDRYVIDFITQQTSHDALQNSADAKSRAGKTRRETFAAEKSAQAEAEEKAQHRREQNAEYQRRHRDRVAAEASTHDSAEMPPAEPVPTDMPLSTADLPGSMQRNINICVVCHESTKNQPMMNFPSAGPVHLEKCREEYLANRYAKA